MFPACGCCNTGINKKILFARCSTQTSRGCARRSNERRHVSLESIVEEDSNWRTFGSLYILFLVQTYIDARGL